MDVKVLVYIIVLPQISHTLRFTNGVVLPSHMIGDEINNHFHAYIVRSFHQSFKLVHTLRHLHGKVGVDIIIVGNSVWRTSLSLHNGWMLLRDAVGRIIGCRCMANNAREPHMREPHVVNTIEHVRGDVVHLPYSILFHRTMWRAGHVLIAKKASKDLIDLHVIFPYSSL